MQSTPCSTSRPRSTRSLSSAVATTAFSVEPSHSPSGIFHPVGCDPERDHVGAALQIDPVDHQHREAHVIEAAAHQRLEVLARAGDELAADGGLRRRASLLLDLGADRLARPIEAARGDTGEHLLEYEPGEWVAVGEVPVGLESHLLAAVGRPHPGPLHRDPASAERHLASLVAVAHRGALGVVLPLRADDLVDLLGHQLAQHAEPDTHAQRTAPPARRPPVRRAPPARARAAPPRPCRPARTRPPQRVPSPRRFLLSRVDFDRRERSQPERTRREDRRLKFYGLRDNLQATRTFRLRKRRIRP
jgi:hypothetical protein